MATSLNPTEHAILTPGTLDYGVYSCGSVAILKNLPLSRYRIEVWAQFYRKSPCLTPTTRSGPGTRSRRIEVDGHDRIPANNGIIPVTDRA